MLHLKAQIFGAEELQKAFSNADKIISEEMVDMMDRVGIFIEGRSKDYAPYKTGALKGSIKSDRPQKSANNVSVTIGSDIEYAPYQELGTRYIRAKYFLTRATQEASEQFSNFLQDAGAKITAQLAK